MTGTIGCVEGYTALITVKDTGAVVGAMDISVIEWHRILDAPGSAIATIPMADTNCCDIVAQVHAWHHEMQVFRDGVYVFGGPVTTVNIGRGQAVITATDLLGLMNERIVHDPLCFGAACGGAPADLTDLGAALINNAFVVDGHGYELQTAPTGIFGERLYSPGENAWTDMQEVLGLGLDCTVLGRKVILGAANGLAPFGRTGTLTCDDFLGDLQVEEDGLSMATKVIVLGNGFVGIAIAPGADMNGVHPYYGLIEYADTSQSDVATQVEADAAAARVLLAMFPAPQTLIIPSGSQLATTAPVDINELVPGAFTDVIVDCVCRPFASTQVLTKVDVTWDDNGEHVAVTYATIYTINAQLYA